MPPPILSRSQGATGLASRLMQGKVAEVIGPSILGGEWAVGNPDALSMEVDYAGPRVPPFPPDESREREAGAGWPLPVAPRDR